MGTNYFNTLPLRLQLEELGKCRFMEAEEFADFGGWVLDSQFDHEMGSPYLLAHGYGRPVADARTVVEIARAGTYTVWVRAKDWVPSHHPGRFTVSFGGALLAHEFGASGRDWSWERAGTVDLDVGPGLRLWDHGGDAPVVLFLHGYLDTGRSYDDLCSALEGDARCVCLDWRGHGFSGRAGPGGSYHLLDHLKDLSRVFDLLADGGVDGLGRPDALVAHSMGVYALRHAVQEVKKQVDQARLPRLIDNAFLMAADEDADALAKDYKLGPLFELARQVHVYHAVDDLALIVSDTTKFNPDRLGERGPKNLSDDISRLHVIDCGKVSDTKLSHGRHQYYRFAPEVLRDVRQVLAGKPPDEIKGRDPIEPGRRYRLRRSKKLRAKVGAS